RPAARAERAGVGSGRAARPLRGRGGPGGGPHRPAPQPLPGPPAAGGARAGSGRAARPVRGRGVPGRGRHRPAHQPLRGRSAVGVIRLEGVEKTYRTRRGDLVHALAETSLSVGSNEFVTLVGPSGCGKSTLLKLVAGLVPASKGLIRVREEVVAGPFPDVGFVFQQPVLLPWRTVMDNVLFSIEMLGL